MTDRYAVIGNPVEHSKSPLIHGAFARQTAQDIEYIRLLAPLDAFQATVLQFRAAGGKGANVTVPFKLEAWRLADTLSTRARAAGAVNTLSFSDTGILGDNTDGAGLVRDIQANLHIPLNGKNILLLGAGGAAEGVLHPLLQQLPRQLLIANRSAGKAIAMVDKVAGQAEFRATDIRAHTFAELEGMQFDVIINATSTGLTDTALPIPPGIFAAGALAYDMMYGRETPFMALARAQGAQVADGLGMLVEQAAESFYLWRGVHPQTQPIITLLRAA
jgi:shikimate dehydrogenase